jgi:carboxypeptidase C (cathepsin A)
MKKELCSLLTIFSFAIFLTTGTAARAQNNSDNSSKHPDSTAKAEETALPEQIAASTTQGAVDVEGKPIAYTAVAGTLTVGATAAQDAMIGPDGKMMPGVATPPKNPAEKPPTAKMFYVAYFKQGADSERRPITFLYNGGPGSSTVWLHMGAFGPKRVSTPVDTHMPPAPYHLENNDYSLLDASDLVFIDMPGTGFGRIYGKEKAKAFWGVDEDGHAFTRFIARFLTKYNRTNSPKYLFGESYGTTRSAVLSNMLQDNGIDLNGVMLLSSVLNLQDLPDGTHSNPGDDRPYVLTLPTYAATAIYHHKIPQPSNLEAFLKEVENFATGDYAHALSEGNTLSAADKQAIAEKLHTYTSLPVAYLLKANLRVSGGEFEHQLQSDDDLTTGRLDARFSGPAITPLERTAEYDPQSSAISSAYLALFNQYVRETLKYGAGETYLSGALFNGHRWDMKHGQGSGGFGVGMNVMPDLAVAMKTNPTLKVMLNAGYYDLATPFFEATYEMQHLPIPQNLTKNIEYDYYNSGHMVYVQDESLHKLHDNVAAFIRSTENTGK